MPGYDRAVADWQDFPNTSTPIMAAHLDHIEQAVYELKRSVFNVRDYGAVGDNVADDTNAIQQAITAASVTNGGCGLVYVPAGTYKITSALQIPGGTGGFVGGGITIFGDHRDSTCIEQATSNVAIVTTGDNTQSQSVTITDLRLQYATQQSTSDTQAYGVGWDGNPTVMVSWTIDRCWINRCYVGIGISATSGAPSSWNVRVSNTWITSTRHNAIRLAGPTPNGMPSNLLEHLYIANTGVGSLIGAIVPDGTAIEMAAASVVMDDIDLEGWYNLAVNYGGNSQALTVRNFYVEHHVFNALGPQGAFPFLFYCASNSIWDGVHISGDIAAGGVGAYMFSIDNSATLHVRGVSTTLTVGGGSYAVGLAAQAGSRVYWPNDWNAVSGAISLPGDGSAGAYESIVGGTRALTYGATIATNALVASDIFRIVATNGTAFTISNPTNASPGRRITYDIKNSSGGALGAITWGAAFKLAGAFTNPANGKLRTISFYYDGSNWVEINRAAADI